MFHYLISTFIDNYSGTPLRLIDYVSFRGVLALITAFLICFMFGKRTAALLKKLGAQAPARLEGLVAEKFIDHTKDKTPSMGGALVVMAIAVSSLLWCKLDNLLVLIFVGALLLFSLLGFYDDYTKIMSKARHQLDPVKYPKCDGISAKKKFWGQVIISTAALTGIFFVPSMNKIFNSFYVPFEKEPLISVVLAHTEKTGVWLYSAFLDTPQWFAGRPGMLLWWGVLIGYFIFGIILVAGTSNAVNLTDGKDGLAVGCTIFCVLTYGAFAYMSGHKIFADYLNINYIEGASEILIF